MTKISSTTKQIIFVMVALNLMCFGVGIFFSNSIKVLFVGYFLGTIFSILKLVLLEKSISKAIGMPQEKATTYTRLHYTLRYILTGALLLIVSLRRDDISLVAVIITLITIRPAIYFVAIVDKKNNNNKIN